jgi:hypothetical protein
MLEGARQRLASGGQGFGVLLALVFSLACLAGLARVGAGCHQGAGLVSTPFGCSSRYSPPPSDSFRGFSPGFALRMAASLRVLVVAMWGQVFRLVGGRFWTCPHCCPHTGAGSSVVIRGHTGMKKALER